MAADLWFRRIHQKPILPIMALLTVVLVFGWLNSEVLSPYARPRIFGDERGGVVTYDLALFDEQQNAAFVFREKLGKRWSAPIKTTGKVLAGQVHEDKLYLLFPKVLSIYDRDTRKRVSNYDYSKLGFESGTMTLSAVGFKEPQITIFGIDKSQTLRAAQLKDGQFQLLPPVVKEASGLLTEDVVKRSNGLTFFSQHQHVEETLPIKNTVKLTLAATTHGHFSTLLIGTPEAAYAAAQKRREELAKARADKKDPPPAEPLQHAIAGLKTAEKRSHYRLIRFNHRQQSFDKTIDFPKAALAATVVGKLEELQLFVVADNKVSEIEQWQVLDKKAVEAAAGAEAKAADELSRVGVVPFEKGGIFNTHGASELAASQIQGETLLLGQFGGSIRLLNLGKTAESEAKPEWLVLAQLPSEAQTVVFGWFFLVITLVSLLILFGLQTLRQRQVKWPNMPVSRLDDEIRNIVELSHREAQRRNSKTTVTQSPESAVSESGTSESSRQKPAEKPSDSRKNTSSD